VAAAGGIPLHVPPQPDIARVLDGLNGLLVPGGGDLLPPESPPDGAPSGVVFTPVPAAQLAFDRSLLRAALDRQLPVLGICYGMQLLGLELGGTLCYDIASERPHAAEHQLRTPATHPLQWTPESVRLATLLAGLERVNSRHHQCLATVGPRLRVAARAPDGVVEAVEASEASFWVGVQWHPEDVDDAPNLRLFGGFVDAARTGMGR